MRKASQARTQRNVSPKPFVFSSVFSFFSGAGFLDLGFEEEGFVVSFANEFNPEFARAYLESRKKMGVPGPRNGMHVDSVESWLEPVKARQLRAWIAEERSEGRFVGFIGGPPCPDFSVGGKNRGREGENGRLSKSYIDLVVSQKPDWFLFENVKGLWRTKRHREFYDELKCAVQRAGFVVSNRLINAIEYGAPQDRERIIMVGFRGDLAAQFGGKHGREIDESEFPWQVGVTHDRGVLKGTKWPETDPFGETPRRPAGVPEELTVSHWFKRNSVDKHPNSTHGFQPRAGLARFESIAEGDDSRKSFKRLHRWRYSPTACYGNNEVHLHPWKARRLNVAEVLAIQSLPPEFALPPDMTLSAMFKTVGNGVPFLAARGLAKLVNSVVQSR